MKILIANDDGIEAQGIRTLARVLSQKYDVTVVAPDREQSATGQSITYGKNGLSYEPCAFDDGIPAYRVFGTPADCVKFGILHLGISPDLVVSGINHGNNLGSEIMYSGTIGAAYEGAYLGVRSIAVSCGTRKDAALFEAAARLVFGRLNEYLSLELPPFTILNINYPSQPAKGYVYTRMGVQLFDDRYLEEERKYYLRGKQIGYPYNPVDCDVNWNLKHYVTVTPLKSDRTDDGVLSAIRGGES